MVHWTHDVSPKWLSIPDCSLIADISRRIFNRSILTSLVRIIIICPLYSYFISPEYKPSKQQTHPVFSTASHRWSLLGIFQFLKRRTNKLGEFSGCGSKLGKQVFGWNRLEIPRITRNRLTLLEISRNRLTSVVKSWILIHTQRPKVFFSIAAEMDKSRDVWCRRCLDKLTLYMSYNLHRKPWKRVAQPASQEKYVQLFWTRSFWNKISEHKKFHLMTAELFLRSFMDWEGNQRFHWPENGGTRP